ncbi:CD3324 family protein [Alkalihalobacterium bogoriense]|uniref:CD3324 family protein n=1 Tax=Alkalihalobacterium bogoriense TaxID=246272 RepID=UPI00047A0409|nr:CD3324 family protein [Alkalihalobacterium bogoriense]
MSYLNAEDVLPEEVIQLIQQYVDGKPLYIPRKETNKKAWGEKNGTKSQLQNRNKAIFQEYSSGLSVSDLAKRYFLSEKSIQRIIRLGKKI